MLGVIPSLISLEENADLMKEVTMDEVHQAVMDMYIDGAPGPDGMSVAFYQSCWQIIGTDVYRAAQEFFNGTPMPFAFRSNFIAMIQKVSSPTRFSEFRPISLCNVNYKIFA